MGVVSSRARSDFGSLGSRTAATKTEGGQRPTLVLIDQKQPGLLARWRRGSDGVWQGLVVMVEGPDDFLAQWLPASRLAPVRSVEL